MGGSPVVSVGSPSVTNCGVDWLGNAVDDWCSFIFNHNWRERTAGACLNEGEDRVVRRVLGKIQHNFMLAVSSWQLRHEREPGGNADSEQLAPTRVLLRGIESV